MIHHQPCRTIHNPPHSDWLLASPVKVMAMKVSTTAKKAGLAQGAMAEEPSSWSAVAKPVARSLMKAAIRPAMAARPLDTSWVRVQCTGLMFCGSRGGEGGGASSAAGQKPCASKLKWASKAAPTAPWPGLAKLG